MNKDIKTLKEEMKEVIDNPTFWVEDCGEMESMVIFEAEECKLLLDYINQLENLVSRETNRRKTATYDYAQLDKKLDDIRAIVSKSLFKTDLVELCRMKNQIIDVLDSIGGSNE